MDVMNLDPDEICRLFEQWALLRHQVSQHVLSFFAPSTVHISDVMEREYPGNVRRHCTRSIHSVLVSHNSVCFLANPLIFGSDPSLIQDLKMNSWTTRLPRCADMCVSALVG